MHEFQWFWSLCAGLSYWASGGLLAGVPSGRPYPLRLIWTKRGTVDREITIPNLLYCNNFFLLLPADMVTWRMAVWGGYPRKCAGARLTLQIYHGRIVNAHLTLIGWARRSIGRIERAARPIDNPNYVLVFNTISEHASLLMQARHL
jgi:hypothetical protein